MVDKKKEKILKELSKNVVNNSSKSINNDDINGLLKFGELNNMILDFILNYQIHFSEYNEVLFKNLEKLHIYIGYLPEKEISGECKNNKINIYLPMKQFISDNNKDLKNCLTHQLLHLSTYDKKTNSYSTGFHKRVNGTDLGRRLNEGYTEYLCKYYFTGSNCFDYYNDDMKLVSKIERLIGEKEMIKSYFTGDLYNVINKLGNYMDNPLEFIINTEDNIDECNNTLDTIIKNNKSKKMMKK